ncbi:hypothetical protein KI387_015868, partial [Taxus chinensis]
CPGLSLCRPLEPSETIVEQRDRAVESPWSPGDSLLVSKANLSAWLCVEKKTAILRYRTRWKNKINPEEFTAMYVKQSQYKFQNKCQPTRMLQISDAQSTASNAPNIWALSDNKDTTGLFFALVNELHNTGNILFDEIVRRGLLEYFWFDVRCQAQRIRAELERGYDADDERE